MERNGRGNVSSAHSHNMRLLILTPDYPPAKGGIQTVMHRLSVLMHFETMVVARGPCDPVVDSSKSPMPGYTVPNVLRVGGSRDAHKRSLVRLNIASVKTGRRFSPHLVLSGHTVTGPAAGIIKRFTDARVVQYLYADELTAHPRLTSYALRQADASIAISEYTRSLALKFGANPMQLRLIPPGIDLPAHCAPKSERDDARPTLITVARLADRYKGHDVVLRALPLILKAVPECRWVVIGEGPLGDELRDRARAAGLDSHVSFLGALSDEERDAWLGRSHVFVMPSRLPVGEGGEGFGIVYLEAGVHGLPVIAGNAAGAVDAVVDGETGFLVNPTDEAAIASAVIRLLTNRDEAERMGLAGADRATNFAWPLIAKHVEHTLREVAALD